MIKYKKRKLISASKTLLTYSAIMPFISSCAEKCAGVDMEKRENNRDEPKSGESTNGTSTNINIPNKMSENSNNLSSIPNSHLNNEENKFTNDGNQKKILQEERLKVLYPAEHIARRQLTKDQIQDLMKTTDLGYIVGEFKDYEIAKEFLPKILARELDVDFKHNGESYILSLLRYDVEKGGARNYKFIIQTFINLGADLKNAEDTEGTGLIHFIFKNYKQDDVLDIIGKLSRVYSGCFGNYFDLKTQDKYGNIALYCFFDTISGNTKSVFGKLYTFLHLHENMGGKNKEGKTIFEAKNFWSLAMCEMNHEDPYTALIDIVLEKFDYSIFNRAEIENLLIKIVENSPKYTDDELIQARCELVVSRFIDSRERLGKKFIWNDPVRKKEEKEYKEIVKIALEKRK